MRALAVLVALALTPGLAEGVEDLGHFLAEGHTLHAPTVVEAPHDEHEKSHGNDEHGCTTLFHLCACHSLAPSMISTWLTLERTRELTDDLLPAFSREARRPVDGVASETFRPPIA